MCGIYSCISNNYILNVDGVIEHKTYIPCDKHDYLSNRGPDERIIIKQEDYFLAFHRLSIMGVNNGHQPFNIDGIKLLCNGEIYNYKKLQNLFDLPNTTGSDCEVIIYLYKKFGIESAVRLLDGEFAFVLIDDEKKLVHFARDYMGIKPLYFSGIYINNKIIMLEIASLIKSLNLHNNAIHVLPRNIYTYDIKNQNLCNQEYDCLIYQSLHNDKQLIYNNFVIAVEKRISQSERPIGFLLSGGLDSSLVLSVALEYYNKIYLNKINALKEENNKLLERELLECNTLECKSLKYKLLTDEEIIIEAKKSYITPKVFTFGFSLDAPDVKSACSMIGFLRNKYGDDCLHWDLVIQTIESGLKYLSDVIFHLETYDTTTIRASTPMFLISKYIAENTDVKVILSGEGSDELFGGYLYFKYAPNDIAFRSEIINLLNNLYLYDVLRADRVTAANGLEIRPPFLDYEFVQSVLTSRDLIIGKNNTKELLRNCVQDKNLLPDDILYGKKEAFSDAVGLSWKESLVNYTNEIMKSVNDENPYSYHIIPENNEMKFYQTMFYKYFNNVYYLLPKLWLPNQNWVKTGIEPSARVLSVYNN